MRAADPLSLPPFSHSEKMVSEVIKSVTKMVYVYQVQYNGNVCITRFTHGLKCVPVIASEGTGSPPSLPGCRCPSLPDGYLGLREGHDPWPCHTNRPRQTGRSLQSPWQPSRVLDGWVAVESSAPSPHLSLLHDCCSGQPHLPPSLHCSEGGGLSCVDMYRIVCFVCMSVP